MDSEEEKPSGARRAAVRARARFGAWSLAKRAVALVLAAATALGTLVGGIVAAGKVKGWWDERNRPETEFVRTPHLGLEFWQHDRQAPMALAGGRARVDVTLEPGPFYLRVPELPDGAALEVCAWTDDSILAAPVDGSAERVPCLQLSKGIADTEYATGRLHVTREAKNVLTGTRLRPAGERQQEVFFSRTATLTVRGKRIDSREQSLSERRDPLYLLVFVDHRPDRVMQLGEVEKVRLAF